MHRRDPRQLVAEMREYAKQEVRRRDDLFDRRFGDSYLNIGNAVVLKQGHPHGYGIDTTFEKQFGNMAPYLKGGVGRSFEGNQVLRKGGIGVMYEGKSGGSAFAEYERAVQSGGAKDTLRGGLQYTSSDEKVKAGLVAEKEKIRGQKSEKTIAFSLDWYF